MKFLDYFRRAPKSASLAKDRLSIIVARERTGTRSRGPDYLPQLQQELLAVIARYEKIDLSCVTVNVDRAAAARSWSSTSPSRSLPAAPRGRRTGVSESDLLVVTGTWARPWLTVVDRRPAV